MTCGQEPTLVTRFRAPKERRGYLYANELGFLAASGSEVPIRRGSGGPQTELVGKTTSGVTGRLKMHILTSV